MVGAVEQAHAHTLHRVAREHADVHRLANPLLDGGDERARDHAALDLVHELEARRGPRDRSAVRSRCGSRRTGRARPTASCAGRGRWRSRESSPGRAPAAASTSPPRRSARAGDRRSPRRAPARVRRRSARPSAGRGAGRSSGPPPAGAAARRTPSPRRPCSWARPRTPSPARAASDAASRSARHGRPSQSPARVSLSLATAPMSPGPNSCTWRTSLPANTTQLADALLGVRVRVQHLAVGAHHALVDAQQVDPSRERIGPRLEDVREQLRLLGGRQLDLAHPSATRA